MLIALDYDGTYTEDPQFWDGVIAFATLNGHEVMVVTMRYESEAGDVRQALDSKVSRIICTGRKAKERFLASMGIAPHVWIDDSPLWLLKDAG